MMLGGCSKTTFQFLSLLKGELICFEKDFLLQRVKRYSTVFHLQTVLEVGYTLLWTSSKAYLPCAFSHLRLVDEVLKRDASIWPCNANSFCQSRDLPFLQIWSATIHRQCRGLCFLQFCCRQWYRLPHIPLFAHFLLRAGDLLFFFASTAIS